MLLWTTPFHKIWHHAEWFFLRRFIVEGRLGLSCKIVKTPGYEEKHVSKMGSVITENRVCKFFWVQIDTWDISHWFLHLIYLSQVHWRCHISRKYPRQSNNWVWKCVVSKLTGNEDSGAAARYLSHQTNPQHIWVHWNTHITTLSSRAHKSSPKVHSQRTGKSPMNCQKSVRPFQMRTGIKSAKNPIESPMQFGTSVSTRASEQSNKSVRLFQMQIGIKSAKNQLNLQCNLAQASVSTRACYKFHKNGAIFSPSINKCSIAKKNPNCPYYHVLSI